MSTYRLRGVYAITSATMCADPERMLDYARQALDGGVALLQYRDKNASPDQQYKNARAINALCQRYGVPFIVNDNFALAQAVGAAGVHLGREDGSVVAARQYLGANAIIGVTCADSLERALQAEQDRASYVAFGAFYPSGNKPTAPRASLDLLRQARSQISLPICAIGGIQPKHAAELLAAGADMIAAIDGIFAGPDVSRAVRSYQKAWNIGQ